MSGIAGAAAGLGGGFMDLVFNMFNSQRQRIHDKQMAGINYNYAINQMNHSNKLAVEQWERENEYNDPSAVRQRYEAAGISPAAAFGQGAASGAGIAGGLSGGTSGGAMGHSSNAMFSTNFGGLGQDILSGMQVDMARERQAIDLEEKRIDILNKKFENEILNPLKEELQKSLASAAASDATIKDVEAQWAPYMASLRSIAAEKNIDQVEAGTQRILSQIENDESFRALNEEQRKLVIQQTEEAVARILRMTYQNRLDAAMTDLAKNNQEVAKSQKELNEALTSKEKKMPAYLDKQIELIGSQMGLNNAQINKWKSEVAQKWTEIGVNAALGTVAEVRNWVGMFMPFGKGRGKSGKK